MKTLVSMEKFFRMCGVDWEMMSPGDAIDVSDLNVKVKSYDPDIKLITRQRVNKLVRKEDSPIYSVYNQIGNELFKASPAHKVYVTSDKENFEWKTLGEMVESEKEYFVQDYDKLPEVSFTPLDIRDYGQTSPILDFEVDETHAYFANGCLSHNTTPGGNAMKFSASVRLSTRRKENVMDGEKMIGMISHVKAVKNKVATPFQECDMKILFGKGYQTEDEYIEAFLQYKLIDKSGSWITINYTDEKGLEQSEKMQGLERVTDWFKKNPFVFDTFKKRAEEIACKDTVVSQGEEDEEKVIAEQTKIDAKEIASMALGE